MIRIEEDSLYRLLATDVGYHKYCNTYKDGIPVISARIAGHKGNSLCFVNGCIFAISYDIFE
jgi:hypothetical protein